MIFQITQQFLRKTRFKFENGVTFAKGQIMILTFDIHVASLNNLVLMHLPTLTSHAAIVLENTKNK